MLEVGGAWAWAWAWIGYKDRIVHV